MTRRSWIPPLVLGLACVLPGCLPGYANPRDAARLAKNGDPGPVDPSASHPRPALKSDRGPNQPIQPAHFPDSPPPAPAAPVVKRDEPPPPPPILPPPPPDGPVVLAEKAAPESPLAAAFRDLLQNRSADALERLRDYDGASRELLLTLLPLAARVGEGGLDRASPQETAVMLEQVRQVEALLRPRAALTLDKVCLCRRVADFGKCEPWPADHVFQPATEDHYGERIQVYAEVRNFTCRPTGTAYETSLAGVVEIRSFADPKHPVARFDFPASVDRSQTPRQDYFVNFKFYLPPMPEGRYTLHVLVKDMLAPVGDDATPRRASRSLDFTVGRAGRAGP